MLEICKGCKIFFKAYKKSKNIYCYLSASEIMKQTCIRRRNFIFKGKKLTQKGYKRQKEKCDICGNFRQQFEFYDEFCFCEKCKKKLGEF